MEHFFWVVGVMATYLAACAVVIGVAVILWAHLSRGGLETFVHLNLIILGTVVVEAVGFVALLVWIT